MPGDRVECTGISVTVVGLKSDHATTATLDRNRANRTTV
nr:hypothetical protein JVH1_2235 [Rhodococcus sp. JVH1]